MSVKDDLIEALMDREGGYVNDPKDSGGETNHGITVALARRHGYTGAMKDMSRLQAKEIYLREFWDPLALSQVEMESPKLAEELFDTAVNCGPERAIEWLQRSLNALNNLEWFYADLKVDRKMGSRTIAAIKDYIKTRKDVMVLLTAMNCFQGVHYIDLAWKRPKDEKFLFGWLKNRVKI